MPAKKSISSMIFASRQNQKLSAKGVLVEEFYLKSKPTLVNIVASCIELRRKIIEYKPDIIHANYGSLTAFITLLCTRGDFLVTFRGSDLNPTNSSVKQRVSRLMSLVVSLLAKQIICVSTDLAGKIPWASKKTSIIPSGVDVDVFKPMARESARRRLGWPLKGRIILFNAGRSPELKGLALAKEAVSLFNQNALGDPRATLQVLKGGVRPSEMPYYINAADAVMLCSQWEGSPNIVKEALACCTPIVSVDVGDVRERFFKETLCILCESNAASLASGLRRAFVLERPEKPSDGVVNVSLMETTSRLLELYLKIISSQKD